MIQFLILLVSGSGDRLSGSMDSKITVCLIVILLAALRGLMQRSKVKREIEERKARGLVSLKARRTQTRTGPAVDTDSKADADTQSAEHADQRE